MNKLLLIFSHPIWHEALQDKMSQVHAIETLEEDEEEDELRPHYLGKIIVFTCGICDYKLQDDLVKHIQDIYDIKLHINMSWNL